MKPKKQTPRAQKRIVVVDDHPMTRKGISEWIRRQTGFTVCAEAESAEQALDAVSKCKPDPTHGEPFTPGARGCITKHEGGDKLVEQLGNFPSRVIKVTNRLAENVQLFRV